MLMFASDHPHVHDGGGAAVLETVDVKAREAITRTTPSTFYRLPG
jgi:hypothetical protein